MRPWQLPLVIPTTSQLATLQLAVTPSPTDFGTSAAGSAKKNNWSKSKSTADCPYVNGISKDQLESFKGRSIFDYMGRRNDHFFMHEKSIPDNPSALRYTYCQESKERRKRWFQKIRNKIKKDYPDNAVQRAEKRLAKNDTLIWILPNTRHMSRHGHRSGVRRVILQFHADYTRQFYSPDSWP